MKTPLKQTAVLLLFCLPLTLAAQRFKKAAKKDSLTVLTCPLLQAIESAPEKPAYTTGEPEKKIILSSNSDTLVKACISGKVTNVQQDDEGKFEIIFYHNDYWFWYSGISKATVRKGQQLKEGDAIGVLPAGQKMELLIYDFETQLEPKKYLNCGGVRSNKL